MTIVAITALEKKKILFTNFKTIRDWSVVFVNATTGLMGWDWPLMRLHFD